MIKKNEQKLLLWMYKKRNPDTSKIFDGQKVKSFLMFDFSTLLKSGLYSETKLRYALENLEKFGLIEEVKPLEIIKRAKEVNPNIGNIQKILKRLYKENKKMKEELNKWGKLYPQLKVFESEVFGLSASDMYLAKTKRTFTLTKEGLWLARILERGESK